MNTKLTRTRLLAPILLALVFFTASNAFAQQIDPTAWYRITAKHSGKCLSVEGGASSVDNGIGVIQWDCLEPEETQKWQIRPVGFGWYNIIAKHSGKALETRGGVGATGNRVLVQQGEHVSPGAANQQWWFNPLGDGFYQIVARHSGKSLDVNGDVNFGATGNGALVQQWEYLGGDNQKWRLTPLPDVVAGKLTYTDTEDPAGVVTFDRPIIGCRVQVWRAGVITTTTETDNDGRFSVFVPRMPDGTQTRLVVYATNAAAQVLGEVGPFFMPTASQPSSGGSTFFSKNFDHRYEVRSFNAAQNIRLAYNFAHARRDPNETEVIPIVDVSFIDHDAAGTRYNHPASSLLIHHNDSSRDLVIMHEYAHFLEDKIGSFLLLPSYHDTCFTSQRCLIPEQCANLEGTSRTQLINSPENAWMEGFADYFAMAVKRANPAAQFNLAAGGTMTESELNNPGPCLAVGREAFDGHIIDGEMVEKFVASALWAASSPPGSDAEVFQIFDHELDGSATGRLPNISQFRQAWVRRPGLDRARLDSILREHMPTVFGRSVSPLIIEPPVVIATTVPVGIAAEVAECKTTLQSGRVSWGAGTSWAPGNIDRLCNGTRNARNTISCFQSNVGALGWAAAIDACK